MSRLRLRARAAQSGTIECSARALNGKRVSGSLASQWAASACQGRIVSCLEGGYNLQTLGETVRRHVAELQLS